MPIKNYTTVVSAYESLGQIQGMLAAHGANKILVEYDAGAPVGVMFSLSVDGQTQGFLLPANVDGVMAAFQRQKVKADREQAERTAWRNIRDWVAAQMAFIERRRRRACGRRFFLLHRRQRPRCIRRLRAGSCCLATAGVSSMSWYIFFRTGKAAGQGPPCGQALWQGMPTCTPPRSHSALRKLDTAMLARKVSRRSPFRPP